MKAFLVVLVAASACVQPARSLQCYTCRAPTDIRRCTRIATCKLNENACRTTELSVDSGYPFFGNITITRGCSSRCVPSSPWGIGEKHPVSCCYTDLCNSNPNGVVGLKAHHATLGITAAVLCILVKAPL
ncbi:PREDICTED: secreted Ly-6/uPAR-related protein 1-like [Crocodylus porosus]|uniref:secreted Ly-6/uPAR-related protein 1-like n=1 Tax=Crocodylus porosus TaxID=8502 RepID=UPI00093C86B7|nr:PREDICTED: secreted Ly-6/uPAR-related protein 1-like [Crocodylus porosus]